MPVDWAGQQYADSRTQKEPAGHTGVQQAPNSIGFDMLPGTRGMRRRSPPHTDGQVSWLADLHEQAAFPLPVALFARSFPGYSDEFARDLHPLPFSPDAWRPTPAVYSISG